MKTESNTSVPVPVETLAQTFPSAPAPTLSPETIVPPASRRRRTLVIGIVLVALTAGLVAGVVPRVRAHGRLAAAAAETVLPTVTTTTATRQSGGVDLLLPGEVRAYEETRIYARADGYLLRWHTDIGAKVQAGQVLAEIDTPELDQELNQAQAARAQAQANFVLAQQSAERWQSLLAAKAVSQQEVDEKTSAFVARQADVNAAAAAVSRLEKLTAFKEVRAPFAGTITRRYVDTGALIRAGASGNAGALFDLSQTDTLRVHVNVPQPYLREVVAGVPVQLHVAEYPGRVFTGQVVRTSGALDPATRTLLTEIEVNNRDGALLPGLHIEAQLRLVQANPPLVIPAASLLVRGDGLQVAVVEDPGTIRLLKVQLGRDLGTTVEIVAGLDEGARIVTHPSDTLADGLPVRVAGLPPSAGSGSQVARR